MLFFATFSLFRNGGNIFKMIACIKTFLKEKTLRNIPRGCKNFCFIIQISLLLKSSGRQTIRVLFDQDRQVHLLLFARIPKVYFMATSKRMEVAIVHPQRSKFRRVDWQEAPFLLQRKVHLLWQKAQHKGFL